MFRKYPSRSFESEDSQKIALGLNRLEKTLTFEEQLCVHGTCNCLICFDTKGLSRLVKNKNRFQQGSAEADRWLQIVLSGLCISHAPSLQIFVPDICFVDGQSLVVFHTDPRENRIKRPPGMNPLRTMFQVMLRLRKKYKWMLGENYKKKLMKTIDPSFMHEKYLNHVVPTYYTKGDLMDRKSKNLEQNFVIHKNAKLADENIQQHKLQENEPFCTVKFKNGSSQVFTKKQFQKWMDMKNKGQIKTAEISYVQSYIKQKQETDAFFVSNYSVSDNGEILSQDFDQELYDRTEKQVLTLIGGMSKFSKDYEDLQNFEDEAVKLMERDVQSYVKSMTYKIVHYLGMASRIYIKHIKINWLLNDINAVYIQSILEMETFEVAISPLKYCLPPKEKASRFYRDSDSFMALYMKLQIKTEQKRKRFRAELIKQKQQGQEFEKYNFCEQIPQKKTLHQNKTMYNNLDSLRKERKQKSSLGFQERGSSKDPPAKRNSFCRKYRHQSQAKSIKY